MRSLGYRRCTAFGDKKTIEAGKWRLNQVGRAHRLVNKRNNR